MEQKSIYYISEAAKKVQVENHVLRYWEEELQLPIKRNEMGHRYYTEQDVKQLQEIKLLKDQGLQLKAIRMILLKAPEAAENQMSGDIKEMDRRDKLMEMVKERVEEKTKEKEEMLLNRPHKYVVALSSDTTEPAKNVQESVNMDIEKNQKAARLQ